MPIDPTLPLVVCIPVEWWSPFPDNVVGVCDYCGRPIQYRPHIPKPSTLVCTPCYTQIADPWRDQAVLTSHTIAELIALLDRDDADSC